MEGWKDGYNSAIGTSTGSMIDTMCDLGVAVECE
jgi:hypothetical protein